jgi:hypothetical protein
MYFHELPSQSADYLSVTMSIPRRQVLIDPRKLGELDIVRCSAGELKGLLSKLIYEATGSGGAVEQREMQRDREIFQF